MIVSDTASPRRQPRQKNVAAGCTSIPRTATPPGFHPNAAACQILAWRRLYDKLLATPPTPMPSPAPSVPRSDSWEVA